MDRKTVTFYLLILFVLFVAIGDRVLPQPLSNASLQTRTSINKFLLGLAPKQGPKLKPYERTEKAIEREEGGSRN